MKNEKNEKDELYKILLNEIHDQSRLEESAQELIIRVSQIYAIGLLQSGFLASHFFDDVLSDIEAETLEMYRKKTYGYFSLYEYRMMLASGRSS